MPSSSRNRRVIAAVIDSPGSGWPQQLLVRMDGQVRLLAARRLTSSQPSRSKT